MRDELLAAIRSDRFPEGRLPPEAELATQLGVSRTTIRAALQSLAEDGIVSRRRRHGTVVNRHLLRRTMPLTRLVPFRALIEQSGYTPSVDPQVVSTAPAGDEVAEALQIDPGDDAVVVERLLRGDGEPVMQITDWVPRTFVAGDPAGLRPAASTFEFLTANGIGAVDYASADVVPRVAADGRPRDLEIAPGSAYVELREVLFSREHTALAYSRIEVDDRLVRFSLLRRDI